MGLKDLVFGSQFTGDKSTNGWIKIPIGPSHFIFQWGESTGGAATVKFPIAFTTQCFFVTYGQMTESSNSWYFTQIVKSDRFGFLAQTYGGGVGGGVGPATTVPFQWLSIGY